MKLSCPTLLLSLLAAVLVCPAWSAPRSRLTLDAPEDGIFDKPLHRLYLPVAIAPGALAGAFKAHARAFGSGSSETEQEFPLMDYIQQKRTTSSAELFDPLSASGLGDGLASSLSGIKRKMFWQPLGYMPASARAHHSNNSGGGSSSSNRNSAQDNGSNVFRYG